MRTLVCGLLTALAIAGPAAAIEAVPARANVYIDSMDGFGSYLAAAFRVKGVAVEIVADRRQADFELVGSSSSKESGVAHSLLLDQGSNERASISMINLKTGQVVFAYSYSTNYALFGKKSSAESCAKHLRAAILKGEVDLGGAAVAPGHHAGETTAVPAGEPDVQAAIPPARQLLPAAIASDPAGARIEVEGIFAGSTPATIRLQPGEYRVTLALAGHETWDGKLKVEAGTPAALAAALPRISRAAR
jgi:hypothetical protein